MIKLDRKRKGLQLLWAPFPIACAFLVTLLELDIPLIISVMIAGFILVIASILLLKSSSKPAAWIENETLTIRGGFSSSTVISLSTVESMRYITGEVLRSHGGDIQRDVLHVKMKGFSEWEIPIVDSVEHLLDRRLYLFIRDNFYDLPYQEQVY